MEIWKDIPGYEGLYQVSDYGRVKSFPRRGAWKERILKNKLSKNGYPQVHLCKDGKVKTLRVHRIVALAFLDGDHSLTVNHIDECKTNNHLSNLEYLSQGDNIRKWIKNNPDYKDEINKRGLVAIENWNKNNPGRNSEIRKKANMAMQEINGQKILDTQTNKIFPSIKAVSRYMHEEEGAKGPHTWFSKIRRGKQDRFKIC